MMINFKHYLLDATRVFLTIVPAISCICLPEKCYFCYFSRNT